MQHMVKKTISALVMQLCCSGVTLSDFAIRLYDLEQVTQMLYASLSLSVEWA